MIKFVLICAVFYSSCLFSQNNLLFTGNVSQFCPNLAEHSISYTSHLPEDLSLFDAIFIFSSANSILKAEDILKLMTFLDSGKGIYLGSENWPLQAESNQMTSLLYSKENWGDFNDETSYVSENSIVSSTDSIPSGQTTVAFPLDYRLNVDVWVNDEPLILSGNYLNGRIIIDGGYSRFYCVNKKNENDKLLIDFLKFLVKN